MRVRPRTMCCRTWRPSCCRACEAARCRRVYPTGQANENSTDRAATAGRDRSDRHPIDTRCSDAVVWRRDSCEAALPRARALLAWRQKIKLTQWLRRCLTASPMPLDNPACAMASVPDVDDAWEDFLCGSSAPRSPKAPPPRPASLQTAPRCGELSISTKTMIGYLNPVSYTHLRAHET